ncbi:MAG: deoxyguanosinetriphosphate triphosphohydrolase [bacterium]
MKSIHEWEERTLAEYAVKSAGTRGREYAEEEHPYRSPFQRDRDRVIHSSAFRRLEFKTQVFVPFESDYYRTRLTHTIEVAQISRTCAKRLRLNEELTEAVALAHDIGHPPFGHTGEEVLHHLMRKHGGFEHNRQGLRIVEKLESRYPGFPGLNLTWEVREGVSKHRTSFDVPELGFVRGTLPSLEAQVVNRADEITYISHDTDDGLKSGILGEDELRGLEICKPIFKVIDGNPALAGNVKMRRYQLIRMLIDAMVSDLVGETERNVGRMGFRSVDDVRRADGEAVCFSGGMERKAGELRDCLYERFYKHRRIRRMAGFAKKYVTGLFEYYLKNLREVSEDFRGGAADEPPHRIVCDYVAGMTDRFAVRDYKRIAKRGRKRR